MKVVIQYETNKTKQVRTKTFIKPSLKEALAFFEWRYGHKIISLAAIY